MFGFPEVLPDILIQKVNARPFKVRTMQGLDLKFGVKQNAAEYSLKSENQIRKTIEIESYIKGFACIHGIRCLEFKEVMGLFGEILHELTQFIVVSDTHIKTIAAMEEQCGVNTFQTFLDDQFLNQWGVSFNNLGIKIDLEECGDIKPISNNKLLLNKNCKEVQDIVGRYVISLNDKEFDTIRQVYIGHDEKVTEFYYDIQGREILKRHFASSTSSEGEAMKMLYRKNCKESERIYINDVEYICVTYVLHDYSIM